MVATSTTRSHNADDPLPEKTPPRLGTVPTGRRKAAATIPASASAAPATDGRSRSMDDGDLATTNEDRTEADSFLTDPENPMSASSGSHPEGYTEALPEGLIGALSSPSIEDNTPAAEALRANAEVHVRRVGKLARRVHVQTIRKFMKRATLRGNKRGKPPRIPPPHQQSGKIYVLEEEEGDEEEEKVEEPMDDPKPVEAKDPDEHEIVVNKMPKASDDHMRVTVKIPDHQKHISFDIPMVVPEMGKKKPDFDLSSPIGDDFLHNYKWRIRRKRKDLRKSYVKGKVIDGQHELYALSIAVMLGVRTSIGATNAQMNITNKRWLSSDDFMAAEKYVFRPSGGPKTPPHQLGHTFKFKDYSPVAFAYLRRLFGHNEFDFLLSVCGNANFIEFISNAKSGQFFFYSSDGKFMIKTMTNAESKFLRRILPHYFRHCCQNPNTFITKFLGMYRVKLYHLRRNVKFVIMDSVYYTDKYLQGFYDLKGSVTGRDAKPHHDVKKDNDLRRALPEGGIALDPVVRARARKQIIADCDFMRRMKIMDYSMLIGIHHIPPKHKNTQNGHHNGFRFTDHRRENHKLSDLVRSSFRGDPLLTNSVPQMNDNGVRSHLSMRSASVPSGLGGGVTGGRNISDMVSNALEKIDNRLSLDGTATTAMAVTDYGVGLSGDDDDNSYLEGCEQFNASKRPVAESQKMSPQEAEALERKKQQTIEKVYWPFHRFFDINGYRRVIPGPYLDEDEEDEAEEAMARGFMISEFVPPLSDRKDGGLEMDTAGLTLPSTVRLNNGREQEYEGKIFYMGIIDILQQYNIRKRLEARYRRILGAGWQDASCVHPTLYAERFIRFFDEYSRRAADGKMQEGDHEEILFSHGEELEELDLHLMDSSSDDDSHHEEDGVHTMVNTKHHESDTTIEVTKA